MNKSDAHPVHVGRSLWFLPLAACFILVMLVLHAAAQVSAVPLASPNIVVIMVDDLDDALANRLLDEGYLPQIQTHLRDQGTLFQNSFVTVSLCCPSRATFLTGQYAHNHRVLGNDLPSGSVLRLDASNTLATWLQAGGYQVGHVGKYLNQYGTNPTAPISSPLNPANVPPGYDYWRGLTKTYVMYGYEVNVDGTLIPYGTAETDYQTDVLAGMVTSFITHTEAADAQPFFLIVTPLAPHVEVDITAPTIRGCTNSQWAQTLRPAARHANLLAHLVQPRPPSFNEADVTDKPPAFQANVAPMTPEDMLCAQRQYQNRAESMLAVDELVGRLVTSLKQFDEWDNTVVIFTSDNGYYVGEHRLYQKIFPYEEGIRVPLIIRAPGYAPGQRVSQVVLNNDLAPTIAALAGVTPGRVVDGRSLVPLLQDPNSGPGRETFLVTFEGHLILFGYFPHFTAVRTTAAFQSAPNQLFIRWADGSREQYTLSTDPFQLASRHADPQLAADRRELDRLRRLLRTCQGDVCRALEDGIVPYESFLPIVRRFR